MGEWEALFDPSDLQTLMLAWPRMLTFWLIVPLLRTELIAKTLRSGVMIALCLPVLPMIRAQTQPLEFNILLGLATTAKELLIGLTLGLSVSWVFWAAESVGAFIDNQAGGSVSSQINPATGNDTPLLGGLLQQTFVAYIVALGGIAWLTGLVYESYRLWPILEWRPRLDIEQTSHWLRWLDRYLTIVVLYAAPPLLCTVLIDLGFGLAGRFAPQMQVFFLAMPVKSTAVLLILAFYLALLIEQLSGHFAALKTGAATAVKWLL